MLGLKTGVEIEKKNYLYLDCAEASDDDDPLRKFVSPSETCQFIMSLRVWCLYTTSTKTC